MKTLTYLLCCLFVLGHSLSSCAQNDNKVKETLPKTKNTSKIIIGQTAEVYVTEGKMNFLGRVDTGAATTSINAQDIEVEGDTVSFTMINQEGKTFRFKSPIEKESLVKNAEAQEKRYHIYLTLVYDKLSKKVLVNLNDRSTSNFKILLGRNWLSKDFLVDVDKK